MIFVIYNLKLNIKVNVFYKTDFKFAIYHQDGSIENDNTGLKGEVANWVKNKLLKNELPFINLHFINNNEG